MRYLPVIAMVVALLPTVAFPNNSLDRPDPGIGAGFANAMAEKFMADHNLNRAEADCLVYEVVQEARRISYAKDQDTLAKELLHVCREK